MKRAILEMPANFVHHAFIELHDYHVRVVSGLPEDAKFCACHYDHQRSVFQMIYESQEFRDIPEGELLPVLERPEVIFVECVPELQIPQYEP